MTQKNWAAALPAVKSKAEMVYDTLHAAIAAGDLRAGDRVNMDELARSMGVSKIPIREAVKRLESDGLLVSRAHAGVIVAGVEEKEMRGVFLAREAIEGLVGRLAAEHATEDVVAALETVQQDMRAALGSGRVDELPELNSAFHRRLAEASGYQILSELTEQLLLTVRRYRVSAPVADQNWNSVIDEHDTIIAALRERDPDTVAAACGSHVLSQAGREATHQP
ncbi:MAG TPA: GntR family transcriptional regulator [Actinokineospora sp.]|nr:GntR family transcriptional regulator [Actinokineospora sp.]